MNLSSAIFLATCAACSPSLAAEGPTGPSATFVRQWFTSDLTLGCLDPNGNTVACGPANQPFFTAYYGNADSGSGTTDAVVMVTYVNDPTGNAQLSAVAAFRLDGGGHYRLSKRLPDVQGDGVVPGSSARFGGGKVTMTVVVMKPSDSRCCPTGRKQISLNLR